MEVPAGGGLSTGAGRATRASRTAGSGGSTGLTARRTVGGRCAVPTAASSHGRAGQQYEDKKMGLASSVHGSPKMAKR